MFQALVTRRDAAGVISSAIESLAEKTLPPGQVRVEIEWTGLNYKDALCLTGRGGLVRNYPHVAGIDFAGRVIESADARYRAGQGVVLTGWRVGELYWGGFAQQAVVDAGWLVPLPRGMSSRDAMVLGTAGLTAMLAVNRLKGNGLAIDDGEVLVTGAGGGAGSLAVMLLARLGHDVVALSGRAELGDGLGALGAARVVGRDAVLTQSGKGLDKEQWAAAVDTVGGPVLAELLKKMKRDGAVAALGNAGGNDFSGSVLPFILRGITLFGIDSAMQPYEARAAAWDHLASLYSPSVYESWVEEVALADLPAAAARILAGGVRGRLIVNPRQA